MVQLQSAASLLWGPHEVSGRRGVLLGIPVFSWHTVPASIFYRLVRYKIAACPMPACFAQQVMFALTYDHDRALCTTDTTWIHALGSISLCKGCHRSTLADSSKYKRAKATCRGKSLSTFSRVVLVL